MDGKNKNITCWRLWIVEIKGIELCEDMGDNLEHRSKINIDKGSLKTFPNYDWLIEYFIWKIQGRKRPIFCWKETVQWAVYPLLFGQSTKCRNWWINLAVNSNREIKSISNQLLN